MPFGASLGGTSRCGAFGARAGGTSGPGRVRRVDGLITEAEVLFSGAELDGAAEARCFRHTAGWNITDAELSARGWAQNRSRVLSARGRLKHSARGVLLPARGWQMGGISEAECRPIGAKSRKNRRCETVRRLSVLEVGY